MVYGSIFHELRTAGRVDMMMAAQARFMDLTILSADRDFEAVAGVGVENWLS